MRTTHDLQRLIAEFEEYLDNGKLWSNARFREYKARFAAYAVYGDRADELLAAARIVHARQS